MKTVSEVLKNTRLEKHLSLDEAARGTKIRVVYLEALENGQFEKLPPLTFVRGFIKNYGEYLGLNTHELLAIFRRQFDERKSNRIVPKSLTEPLGKRKIVLTPNRVVTLAILLAAFLFFIYLGFQYRLLNSAPYLDVTVPQDNLHLTTNKIEVVGKTDPDASLSINGQEIQLKKDGIFTASMTLSEGTNTLEIMAVSKMGKKSTIVRKIIVASQ